MQAIIIALGHRARNGKDTAAQAIIDARTTQYDVRRFALADALKYEVNQMYEMAGGWLGVWTKLQVELGSKFPASVRLDRNPDMSDPLCPHGKQRDLLQFWGAYRRITDPFYWVRLIALKISQDKPQIAVITDMRYLNEAFWVKANDGYTVKVNRHGFEDLSINSEHPSEKELLGYEFDYTIDVLDGEMEQLKKDAVTVFDMIVELNLAPALTTDDFTEPALLSA